MIPVEEIKNNIIDYGYLDIRNIEQNPSYYKLEDGTILSIAISLTHAMLDEKQPSGFSVQTNYTVDVYSPKEFRELGKCIPGVFPNPSNIIENDLDFETLKESFSVFELSNGYKVKVKCIVSQISKSNLFAITGEPVYNVNVNLISKANKNND